MLIISNLKDWFEFWDITYMDIILFIGLFLLILLGLYIAIKKDIILGGSQMFVTFFTPYLILMFYNGHKPFWEIPKKRWVMTFASDYIADTSFLGLMLLIFVPLFICVTAKSLHLICSKDSYKIIE